MRKQLILLSCSPLLAAACSAWAATATQEPDAGQMQVCAQSTGDGATARQVQPECGGEDPGGGGGGGGEPVPPFAPPTMAAPQEPMPGILVNPTLSHTCQQFPHAFFGFSQDLARGTPLYLSGVVAPGTYAVFGFYNQFGQLAEFQSTDAARSNCVIHHEGNAFDTNRLSPGYYTVYASFVGLGSPYAPECYYGNPPPNFNYYVTTSGYQCALTRRYVATIRIR